MGEKVKEENPDFEKSRLPLDIVEDILTRMNIKDLTRFLALNQELKGRITSTRFEANRAKLSLEKNSKLFLNSASSSHIIILDENSGANELVEGFPEEQHAIVGYCSGLLCITESKPYYVTFYVCNISTMEFEGIVRRIKLTDTDDFESRHFGFGLDGDDFKIVKITHIMEKEDEMHTVFEIFSCKKRAWLVVLTIRDSKEYLYDNGVFCDGSLYWLVGDIRRYGHLIRWVSQEDKLPISIGRLNLGNNCWDKLAYPKVYVDHYTNLSTLQEKLCLTMVKKRDTEIWSLQTDGHWNKLLKVPHEVIEVKCWKERLHSLVKVGQKILLLDNRDLIWYDVEQQSARIWIRFPRGVKICYLIRESLIACHSLGGMVA